MLKFSLGRNFSEVLFTLEATATQQNWLKISLVLTHFSVSRYDKNEYYKEQSAYQLMSLVSMDFLQYLATFYSTVYVMMKAEQCAVER